MAETKTFVADAPAWIDLSSKDMAASRDFYTKLFGWKFQVGGPDTRGYGMAKIGDKNVAGVGEAQEGSPTAWMLYIGTRDADALAKKVEGAGGKVIAPPFDVLGSGRMAVFQDPVGAFFSAWQPKDMKGFDVTQAPGSFGWAELNARGIEKAKPFYTKVFGWTEKTSPMGEGQPEYTEFKREGESILGGWEMNPMVPAQVPSYWMVYFIVDDVAKVHNQAVQLGAQEVMEPQAYPGGQFSIVTDPQGATFGLMKQQKA